MRLSTLLCFSVFSIAVPFCIISCSYRDKNTIKNVGDNKKKIEQDISRKLTVRIQPFNDLPERELQYVLNRLKTILPNVEVAPRISLPVIAYYSPRNRYRADTLIKWLKNRTAPNFVTVGITSKDISTEKGIYPDWGVMGLAYEPGNACIASSFRLVINPSESLFKVVIHEIGHTQGLSHCPVKTCFMRDAEGKNTTGEEKEFCPSCKKILTEKGWRL
jgi:archaemetzincin